MDIFFAMLCPVHVCAMVLLCWPATWQVEMLIVSYLICTAMIVGDFAC